MAKINVKMDANNIANNLANVGWGSAIEDAERLIEYHRNEIIKLKSSIQVFAERRESGTPWPTVAKTEGETDR